MDEDLTPSDAGAFDAGPAGASEAGGRGVKPAGRKWSIRPGMVLAMLVAAALIVFVVQNGSEVPVKWWFVEVDGPLWAVIIVAAVAGALLGEVVGWVVGRRRRRRRGSR
ncbi:MAG: LapA family protein [Acidimicrobiaceae bacterium]|nr:LapA family protein [Acidimicrobiaceae bacterium]MYJ80940.1 LapA family protein [Acidimicrobiaceae bacterium]MYK75079.1 LapA family protein [Acidimicrobiaceae bacterium]